MPFIFFSSQVWHTYHCQLFNDKSYLYIHIKYTWFGLVEFLWHINHCRLFNAKFCVHIYIKYIWLGLVEFLWHINHCWLFKDKSSLYIYIYMIWFGWILWHISRMYIHIYTYIYIYVYDLLPNSLYVTLSLRVLLVLRHISRCRLSNANPSLFIYIRYIWFVNIGQQY